MEHINILNRIIEADKNAQTLAAGAAAKRGHLEEDIAREREWLRRDHMDRAQKQAAAGLAREKKRSGAMITELDEKLRRDIAAVDRRLAGSRGEFAAKVFAMVLEDGE